MSMPSVTGCCCPPWGDAHLWATWATLLPRKDFAGSGPALEGDGAHVAGNAAELVETRLLQPGLATNHGPLYEKHGWQPLPEVVRSTPCRSSPTYFSPPLVRGDLSSPPCNLPRPSDPWVVTTWTAARSSSWLASTAARPGPACGTAFSPSSATSGTNSAQTLRPSQSFPSMKPISERPCKRRSRCQALYSI